MCDFMSMYLITSVKPSDGPIGDLLHALGRHAHRASHIHFTLKAPGYDECVPHYSTYCPFTPLTSYMPF